MPEQPEKRFRPSVHRSAGIRAAGPDYAELQVTSNFTFLRGASHPEELVQRSAEIGHRAIALTDLAGMAGMVRAHVAAKQAGIQLVIGSRIDFDMPRPDGGTLRVSLLLYPTDTASYGRLCSLITTGRRCRPKGTYHLEWRDIAAANEGLLAIVLPPAFSAATATYGSGLPREPDNPPDQRNILAEMRDLFHDDRLSLAACPRYTRHDSAELSALSALSLHMGIPLVAVHDVLYHIPDRQPLHDVISCIYHHCTLEELGLRRMAHAERHLKSPGEMADLFAACPGAISRTMEVARRAGGFSLDQLTYRYPREVCPPGKSPMAHLEELTWQGAARRYPHGVPPEVIRRLNHEFELIRDLNYPAYFLTVHDIVQFARGRDILCQGRGAAANSAVCYCLGITAVDPQRVDLLVERFISRQRNEPPDIDIDFEHQRREEVIQYIYQRFGRRRAALTAALITYRRRSAIRDVGKALGFSADGAARLAGAADWWDKGILTESQILSMGLNPQDTTLNLLIKLAGELIGFPRHLSQHVGGFVISDGPLCELVPIENAAMADRTIIQWDKDDIEALGILKIDILALGMLTCIRRSLDLINHMKSDPPAEKLDLHTVPPEVPRVYDMLCRGDSIGVFQVESRAQTAMLPRMLPRCYYDLVVQVAIVRPGPIQGGMVHPYLRRRNGEEPIDYPSPEVKQVLERTLGVPLFQEQVMRLAMVAAGFTGGQADALRRSMAAWKRKGNQLEKFGHQIIAGMLANGYSQEFAQRCFNQIKGFGEYGFPESHAASFALLVYVSAWIKCFHPAAFAAGLLNSQPMGFYPPAQIIRCARDHGVPVRPVDVNRSQWECTLESPEKAMHNQQRETPILRLGMGLVRGLSRQTADQLAACIQRFGPFSDIHALWRKSGVHRSDLRKLARADAFGSFQLTRQQALWSIAKLSENILPLFDVTIKQVLLHTENPSENAEFAALPPISPAAAVVRDYQITGLSLKAHPMSFVRDRLKSFGVLPAIDFSDPAKTPDGSPAATAGLVLVRQRPQTAAGILFVTLEDETGIANLIVKPAIYRRWRKALRSAAGLLVWGTIQRHGQVVHLLVRRAADMAEAISPKDNPSAIGPVSRDFH